MTSAAASEVAITPLPRRRVVEFRAHDFQLQILKSRKKLAFCGAGVGVGKTEVGTLWSLMRCKETPPGVLGLIAANTYGQLFDATLRKVYRNLDAFGVPHKPVELPRAHAPFTLQVWNGSHWAEILCRSMESYENLAGVELGWFWLDEVWLTPEDAYKVILARLRDSRMRNSGLLTTTLEEPTSWLYEQFVTEVHPETTLVVYAPTEVNRRNLPDGYIEGLQRSYSAREAERMLGAKWVSLEGSTIYYAFDRPVHVKPEAEFDPALPILWALDFNIGQGKPMSSCLAQLKKGEGPPGRDGKPVVRPELHVFDEIVIDSSDTNDAVTEFKGRPWLEQAKAGVKVYGDASGRSKDTRSKKTDYEIIRQAGFENQFVPEQNGPIRERHNAVNALLKNAAGDVRLRIHPRCKVLCKGLETVKLRKGAGYLEDETREQHVTTALGYLVVRELPMKPRYEGGVINWT